MKKTALITNGFFVTAKTEEIRLRLLNSFFARGVRPEELRNSDFRVGNDRKEFDFEAALFWDKDVMLARYLESCGVKVINCSDALEICDDKGLTAMAAARLPMPKTIVAPFTYENIGYTELSFLDDVMRVIDFPIVVKERHGSFGQQVYLARSGEELVSLVKKITPKPMLFQQYVECGSKDYRLEVVGDEVVAAVMRTSSGDFRANATLGGTMTAVVPTEEQCALAVLAAKAVGAEIAGVDILPGKEPLLCEINANAHFKRLEEATGIDVAGKIVDYFLERV